MEPSSSENSRQNVSRCSDALPRLTPYPDSEIYLRECNHNGNLRLHTMARLSLFVQFRRTPQAAGPTDPTCASERSRNLREPTEDLERKVRAEGHLLD